MAQTINARVFFVPCATCEETAHPTATQHLHGPHIETLELDPRILQKWPLRQGKKRSPVPPTSTKQDEAPVEPQQVALGICFLEIRAWLQGVRSAYGAGLVSPSELHVAYSDESLKPCSCVLK